MSEYKKFLLSNIKPWAREASGGKMINCRCFYCRDSDDINHGHFYISLPTDKDPSMYYCQKCKAHGLVTPIRLMDWGVYDSNIAIELANINKNLVKHYNNKYHLSNKVNILNTRISMSDNTLSKLRYLQDRLGYQLTYQDCIDLKIVLNLYDILEENKLKYTRDPRIIETLNSDFIGFLSHNNSCLNMRNVYMKKDIHPSINKRYINYNLVDVENHISKRFYTIPTTVDILYGEPIHLHVAEGPFDILSIFLNLRKISRQHIYIAVGGTGYNKILEYFIYVLRTPNLEIHLYPDNDMSRDEILRIVYKINPFGYTFTIHRNIFEGEKDFGVPLNRINERIEYL